MPRGYIRRFKDAIFENLLDMSQKRTRPEALATWRGWLAEGNAKAIMVFLGPGTEKVRLSVNPELAHVKYNINLADIGPEDWGKFVDLGFSMIENTKEAGYAQSVNSAMTVALMRAIGHCKESELPLGTWLALWRANSVIALGSIGMRGYAITLATNDAFNTALRKRASDDYGKKELARVGTDGVIVWARDSRGQPVAKRMFVGSAKDVQPLLVSSDKESRILGAKLLGEVRKKPVAKISKRTTR